MNISDWIAVISLSISVIALIYSFISNTKKYELTYQYYNDILIWHNQVIEVLTSLKLNDTNDELKKQMLVKLSSLIESGRFYFPNIDRKDGFGKQKPIAYQGYRNVILDFLVYEYQLFEKDDYKQYLKHAEILQRFFTSYVFQYLEPSKQKKKIHKNTNIKVHTEFTINEFLSKSPESIFSLYPIDSNEVNWYKRPTER
jgi:hypothetical protein